MLAATTATAAHRQNDDHIFACAPLGLKREGFVCRGVQVSYTHVCNSYMS